MSPCSTTCKLLIVSMLLVSLCSQDVDAWRRFRFRFRWRKAWRIVKPIVKRVVISYVTGYITQAECQQGFIVPRSDWNAGPSSGSHQSVKRFDKVYIYSAGQNTCSSQEACEKLLRVMQNTDRQGGFHDIKPNFLVGQDGQIYEGRGWDIVGDYDRTDSDDQSIGLAFMGDFSSTAPNQASLDAVRKFLECSEMLKLNPSLDVAEGTLIADVIQTWGKEQN